MGTCWCGKEATLFFGGESVCRDDFAALMADAKLDARKTEAEAAGEEFDFDAELVKAEAEGYDDADTLLNGGRLPY